MSPRRAPQARVALTFDDGPGPYTAEVVRTLRRPARARARSSRSASTEHYFTDAEELQRTRPAGDDRRPHARPSPARPAQPAPIRRPRSTATPRSCRAAGDPAPDAVSPAVRRLRPRPRSSSSSERRMTMCCGASTARTICGPASTRSSPRARERQAGRDRPATRRGRRSQPDDRGAAADRPRPAAASLHARQRAAALARRAAAARPAQAGRRRRLA